ncbi:MAG: formyltransferase family protein [Oscillospiraceae bacterium]
MTSPAVLHQAGHAEKPGHEARHVSDVKALAVERKGFRSFSRSSFRDPAAVEALRAAAGRHRRRGLRQNLAPARCWTSRPGLHQYPRQRAAEAAGPRPVQWAILNGDEDTGVTAMYMAPEMDAGDIIEIAAPP